MSFEGYEQCICENGHRYDLEYDYAGGADTNCEICKAPCAFMNTVDDTNVDAYGIIPPEEWKKLLITPEKIETCPTCAHSKVVEEARYRVPADDELPTIRHFWNGKAYERLKK